MVERIYLDNAATSWPKPDSVYNATDAYQRDCGAAAGRGAYGEASEAGRLVARARQSIARLIGAADATQIVFSSNCTDALNLAIHGTLRPGDHAITTDAEHNSVLRPLRTLEQRGIVEVTRVACDRNGLVRAADVAAAIKPNTRLVTLVHSSNVTGMIQPVEEVGRSLADQPALYLVDAAQSVGHLPIDVNEMGADLLAMPGHKGLLGPLGTGALYIRPGVEAKLQSVRQGGTGSQSENDQQPESLPDKYESGNHNVVGLAGLAAGAEFVLSRGVAEIHQHEIQLTQQLLEGLDDVSGVEVFGPREASRRLGVVSIRLAGYSPQEVAGLLESTFRVQVRSGIHCAPRIHAALGTLEDGGTIRFSVGLMNTSEQIEVAIQAVREIAAAELPSSA